MESYDTEVFLHQNFSSTARRKSNASSAFLDVPGGANFYNSRTNDNNDDTVTLRTFSSSNKGSRKFFLCSLENLIKSIKNYDPGIVNRGDSFRRRRSRSSSLIPPSSPMKQPDQVSSHSAPSDSYLVAMLGAQGVGKCALLSQFRTSECINAYETGRGELRLLRKKKHFLIACRRRRKKKFRKFSLDKLVNSAANCSRKFFAANFSLQLIFLLIEFAIDRLQSTSLHQTNLRHPKKKSSTRALLI